MYSSQKDTEFFYSKVVSLNTNTLHALDQYWRNNSSHPAYQTIHQMIECVLIQRGEKSLKQKQLNIIRNLEKSFLISNPMGRLSANIIRFITKILISNKLIIIN